MGALEGRGGRILLLVLAAAAATSAFALPRLRFAHDSRSLLRMDAGAEAKQRALVEDFGSEDILLLAWEVEDLLDPAEFRRLQAVASELAQVPGLEQVYSLAGDEVKFSLGGRLRALRAEDLADAERRAVAREALLSSPVYLGTLYNRALDVVAAGGTLAVAPREQREETLRRVRAVASRHERPGHPIHVAGVTALAVDAAEYAFRDLTRIGLLALVVSVAVLFVLCRSWRETLVAVVATGLPPLYALGLAVAAGLPITALGAALFPVLAVVGITSSVHLLHVYGELRREGHDAGAAAALAARRLAPPILLSLLTTAAAFASLQATGVAAFRAGGHVVALGLVLAAPVVLLGVPAGLALVRPPPPGARGDRLGVALAAVGRRLQRRRRWVVALLLLLLAGGAAAIPRARLELEVLQAFRPQSAIAKTYRFLDERLTATVPVDLVLDAAPDADVTDVLEDLRRFEARAERMPGVRNVDSLATLVDYGKRVNPLPLDDRGSLLILQAGWSDITRRFYRPEQSRFRVKIRVEEGTPPRVLDRLQQEAAAFRSGRATLTGLFVRAVETTRRLVRDMARGAAGMAVLLVAIVLLATRSWRWAVAVVPPNLLPPALVFGGAALLGVALDVSVVAVGAVAVGLAVDDSFHLLFRLKREARAAADLDDAVLRTQASVGRALVLSSVVLVAGLSCLALSSFLPTARFGLFSAAACAVALPADLFALPALIRSLEKGR